MTDNRYVNMIVNLRVLEGADQGEYKTRIASLTAEQVKLVVPEKNRQPIAVLPGDRIQWQLGQGEDALLLESRVIRLERLPPLLLVADVPARNSGKVQRRNDVRMDISLPIWYRRTSYLAPTVAARTRDISAGGVCLVTTEKLDPKERLEATLELGDFGLVDTTLEVVRVMQEKAQARQTIRFIVACSFVQISEQAREAIVRLIFAEQLEQRRRGLL